MAIITIYSIPFFECSRGVCAWRVGKFKFEMRILKQITKRLFACWVASECGERKVWKLLFVLCLKLKCFFELGDLYGCEYFFLEILNLNFSLMRKFSKAIFGFRCDQFLSLANNLWPPSKQRKKNQFSSWCSSIDDARDLWQIFCNKFYLHYKNFFDFSSNLRLSHKTACMPLIKEK